MCKHIPMTLKELRLAAGLRQRDVADILNVARVTYSNYERGTREPGRETLSRLARIFHVSIDYLTGEIAIPRAYQDYSEKERFILENLTHISEQALNYLVTVVEYASNPALLTGDPRSFEPRPSEPTST